jgi:hypothetical protein
LRIEMPASKTHPLEIIMSRLSTFILGLSTALWGVGASAQSEVPPPRGTHLYTIVVPIELNNLPRNAAVRISCSVEALVAEGSGSSSLGGGGQELRLVDGSFRGDVEIRVTYAPTDRTPLPSRALTATCWLEAWNSTRPAERYILDNRANMPLAAGAPFNATWRFNLR